MNSARHIKAEVAPSAAVVRAAASVPNELTRGLAQ